MNTEIFEEELEDIQVEDTETFTQAYTFVSDEANVEVFQSVSNGVWFCAFILLVWFCTWLLRSWRTWMVKGGRK